MPHHPVRLRSSRKNLQLRCIKYTACDGFTTASQPNGDESPRHNRDTQAHNYDSAPDNQPEDDAVFWTTAQALQKS